MNCRILLGKLTATTFLVLLLYVNFILITIGVPLTLFSIVGIELLDMIIYLPFVFALIYLLIRSFVYLVKRINRIWGWEKEPAD